MSQLNILPFNLSYYFKFYLNNESINLYTKTNFSLILFIQFEIEKKIFTWWNRDTFGTRIKTILFGKLVGTDHLGNKYYESKNGKRWVIYAAEIDASKIPVEWYSWIHFTHNKIENNHELKKYDWQKPHQENLTGTDSAYYPNKNKNAIQKKYRSWKD